MSEMAEGIILSSSFSCPVIIKEQPPVPENRKIKEVFFQPLKIVQLKNTTSLHRTHRLLYALFQVDTLQKHWNSAVSKSEDFFNYRIYRNGNNGQVQ